MEKKFVDASALDTIDVEAYGCIYSFHIENYENCDGYARCLIHDKTNNERYHSEGYLEINGHIIITKWNREYDYTRDNWICSKDLIVQIL